MFFKFPVYVFLFCIYDALYGLIMLNLHNKTLYKTVEMNSSYLKFNLLIFKYNSSLVEVNHVVNRIFMLVLVLYIIHFIKSVYTYIKELRNDYYLKVLFINQINQVSLKDFNFLKFL